MTSLGVDLYQMHLAGASYLPQAASVYADAVSDVMSAVPPANAWIWDDVRDLARRILADAETNVENAGNALRLIAYEIAATDAAAAEELRTLVGTTDLADGGER